jgi:hypothetical protein
MPEGGFPTSKPAPVARYRVGLLVIADISNPRPQCLALFAPVAMREAVAEAPRTEEIPLVVL